MVSNATWTAVRASISTPVGPTVSAVAEQMTCAACVPLACTAVNSMATRVSAMGWHKGIRSLVGGLVLGAGLVWGAVINGYLDLPLITGPSSPASGFSRLYPDSTSNSLACLNSDGSGCIPLLPFLTSPGAVGSWTWVNQSSAVATASNGTIYLTAVASTTHNARALVVSTPSTPYEYVAAVGIMNPATANWDALTGIVARESSSGKLFTCQWENDAGTFNANGPANPTFTSATYWSSPTSTTQDYVLDYYRISGFTAQPLMKYGDDGTNRYCSISMDGGRNWLKFAQQARTTNLTANQIGWFADVAESPGSTAWHAILYSWKRTI